MTAHHDVEELLDAALAQLAQRTAIAHALAALPDAQRRALEALLAFEFLQQVAA